MCLTFTSLVSGLCFDYNAKLLLHCIPPSPAIDPAQDLNACHRLIQLPATRKPTLPSSLYTVVSTMAEHEEVANKVLRRAQVSKVAHPVPTSFG